MAKHVQPEERGSAAAYAQFAEQLGALQPVGSAQLGVLRGSSGTLLRHQIPAGTAIVRIAGPGNDDEPAIPAQDGSYLAKVVDCDPAHSFTIQKQDYALEPQDDTNVTRPWIDREECYVVVVSGHREARGSLNAGDNSGNGNGYRSQVLIRGKTYIGHYLGTAKLSYPQVNTIPAQVALPLYAIQTGDLQNGLTVLNDAGEVIPPHSCVVMTSEAIRTRSELGYNLRIASIREPSTTYYSNFFFGVTGGMAIPTGGYGFVTFQGMVLVRLAAAYDIGVELGPCPNSYLATPGYSGLKVIGPGPYEDAAIRWCLIHQVERLLVKTTADLINNGGTGGITQSYTIIKHDDLTDSAYAFVPTARYYDAYLKSGSYAILTKFGGYWYLKGMNWRGVRYDDLNLAAAARPAGKSGGDIAGYL